MTPAEVIAGTAQWCVVEGDCAEVLKTLPVVDALVTDPPYGLGEGRESKAKSRSTSSAKWVRPTPRPGFGASTDWDDAPPDPSLLDLCRSKAQIQVLFGGNYFNLPPARCWLVWDKLNGANDFADCELAWTNLDKAVRRLAYRWNGFIRENSEERGQHPTQKPVGVMQWVIEHATDPGDLVLDPFCGSGTTGVACLRLGRRFIGIEKDPKYAQVARDRMAAESRGLTLSAARAGQGSLADIWSAK